MSDHPYRSLPPKAFWRRSVSGVAPSDLDPVGKWGLTIGPKTRVATAGSCFAQHIARHLAKAGFRYFIAETAHPIVPEEVAKANSYGLFSGRYGNIYTARQLHQLALRALGRFQPAEPVWRTSDGAYVDPFRPSIQPGGFVSEEECLRDRQQHLAAVRRMLKKLDVFVFTLGLTECWRSREDGAVFPICPGVEGGVFEAERYQFHNQPVDEVVADMSAFFRILRQLNPTAQVILTVSPVPLAATAEPNEHVLTATTYSKSVLRVAAGMLRDTHDYVHYFPSYEIITGNAVRGRYYADDLRNVTEEGVSHVMGLFLRHATSGGDQQGPAPPAPKAPRGDRFTERVAAFVEVLCDEEKLNSFDGTAEA